MNTLKEIIAPYIKLYTIVSSLGFLLAAENIHRQEKLRKNLARYEELFKDRYTMKDRGYRRARKMNPE